MPRRIKALVSVVLFAGFLFYAVRSGVLGSGRARWLDAKWLYVSGVCWRNGDSPYNRAMFYETWRAELHEEPICPFIFPPSIIVLVVPISFAPWDTAKHAFDAVNICALGGCLLSLGQLLSVVRPVDWRCMRPWLCLGAACLLSSVPGVMYIGQMTLIAVAGTLGAFCFWRQRRLLPAAACVVLASMKPQISAIPLLFMMVAGGHRQVLLGAGLTALACACGLTLAPTEGLLAHMVDSMNGYFDNPFNRATGRTGLFSLCAGSPLELPAIAWSALGAAFVTGLGIVERLRYSHRANNRGHHLHEDQARQPRLRTGYALQLPFAVAGAFMPLHAYDFVIYMPIVVLSLASRGPAKLWFIPGLLLVGRPGNIQRVLAPFLGDDPGGLVFHLPSIGAIYILLTVLVCWIRATRPSERAE